MHGRGGLDDVSTHREGSTALGPGEAPGCEGTFQKGASTAPWGAEYVGTGHPAGSHLSLLPHEQVLSSHLWAQCPACDYHRAGGVRREGWRPQELVRVIRQDSHGVQHTTEPTVSRVPGHGVALQNHPALSASALSQCPVLSPHPATPPCDRPPSRGFAPSTALGGIGTGGGHPPAQGRSLGTDPTCQGPAPDQPCGRGLLPTGVRGMLTLVFPEPSALSSREVLA